MIEYFHVLISCVLDNKRLKNKKIQLVFRTTETKPNVNQLTPEINKISGEEE